MKTEIFLRNGRRYVRIVFDDGRTAGPYQYNEGMAIAKSLSAKLRERGRENAAAQ